MSTELSDLHQAARNYAVGGIPVFPCVQGGKSPAVESGHLEATTDLAQIDLWWTKNPNYNIGIVPGLVGWSVIDLDPPVGEQSWAKLVAEHGNPPDTYEVETPRGGRHLYFAGNLPPTVSKLADKIDTRGDSSYVLVPPSYVAKQGAMYRVAKDLEVATLPLWIGEALRHNREKAKASVVEKDLPSSIERVVSLLDHYTKIGDVAIEGQGGDHRTYQLCAEVLNLGVVEETALSLILDHWNPHCIPPWTQDELAVKIGNASQYAQNEGGAWAVPPAQEVFGEALDKLPKTIAREERSRYYPRDETEQNNMPEPTWLIPDLLPADATVMLYGPSGSYKSFLALHAALTLASGHRLLDYEGGPQQVVYAAAEGPRSVSRLRRPSWKLGYSVQVPLLFSLVNDVPRVAIPETVQEFCEAIERRQLKPRLVVIDTLARAMAGMNENDARDAAIFIEAIEQIKRKFACTVLVVHHTGKELERGARGSSALEAGFDAVYEVKAHKATKAVAVYCRKQKDADERPAPWTFEGKSVGASLVFFETDPVAHSILTALEDIFDPRKVGAALAELKAFGLDHAVTSSVLSAHMLPQDPNATPEDRQANVLRFAANLRTHAKGKLEAYCQRQGRELFWFLPAPRNPV